MDGFLVPAPQAGDNEKFLSWNDSTKRPVWREQSSDYDFLAADGTWKKGNMDINFLRGDATWKRMELIPRNQAEFERFTWKKLADLSTQCSNEGTAQFKHMVGFTKSFESNLFGESKTLNARLVAMNNGKLSNGKTTGFTFEVVELPGDYNMATNNYRSTIYDGCYIYGILEDRNNLSAPNSTAYVYSSLYDELKEVIKYTNVECFSSVPDSTTTAVPARKTLTNQRIFLPSLTELGGSTSLTRYNVEGKIFDYYDVENNQKSTLRVKQFNGANSPYWTRTPVVNTATGGEYSFFNVNQYGGMGSYTTPVATRMPFTYCFVI